MELNIQQKHELLIKELRKIFPERPTIKVRKSPVSSNEIHKKFDLDEIHTLAIVCSRFMNLHGASVGDINLYKLFENYFLDPEKRIQINLIIGQHQL